MKKTRDTNTGAVLNQPTVRTSYTVHHRACKTIDTQTVDTKTTIYRNHRGRVVWGESA